MPPVLSLPKFQILSSGWAGEGKPSRRSLEETINASHPREMMPNDPVRLIHWKTTARQGKFFVRQFEGTPAGDWWMVLDLHKESQLGAGWDSTEEHGIILTSSLAAQGLNEDHPVGLAINGKEPDWLPPRRNEHQLRSPVESTGGCLSIRDALERLSAKSRWIPGQSLQLLVITACADADWTESLLPLMWRGIRPTVFLLDPVSFGGSTGTRAVSDTLQFMEVPCHVISRELLDKPQARPGHEGEWEWRISATGKAIPVRVAQEDWRGLK